MPKLILYHPLYAPQLVLLFKKLHASNPKSLLSPLRCAFVHVEIWGTREKCCEHDDEHGKSELRCTDNSGVSDATFPIWEHFANMFCMCFFWQTILLQQCASEAFFSPRAGEGHVLSHSRPARLTGLLWGIGCHITSISEACAISLKPRGNKHQQQINK